MQIDDIYNEKITEAIYILSDLKTREEITRSKIDILEEALFLACHEIRNLKLQ